MGLEPTSFCRPDSPMSLSMCLSQCTHCDCRAVKTERSTACQAGQTAMQRSTPHYMALGSLAGQTRLTQTRDTRLLSGQTLYHWATATDRQTLKKSAYDECFYTQTLSQSTPWSVWRVLKYPPSSNSLFDEYWSLMFLQFILLTFLHTTIFVTSISPIAEKIIGQAHCILWEDKTYLLYQDANTT